VSLQVVRWPASAAGVVKAFVDAFPMNVWSWERPGLPGRTIGSSGAEWLNRHVTTKNAPDGDGAAEALQATAQAATATATATYARHRATGQGG
jgi:hypothetical protein